MKNYEVIWRASMYGKTIVKAKSKTDAREKAYLNDENFERVDDELGDWVIDEIKEA